MATGGSIGGTGTPPTNYYDKAPDTGATPPNGVPPGSRLYASGGGTNEWVAPDGKFYFETGGNVSTSYNPQTGNAAQGLRDITDTAGITTPDPHKSPEFQQLLEASRGFGDYYKEDRANAADSRGTDLDTIARLRAAEEGKTPSAAEALMRKAIDQNASQALGLAATLGGSNPGMALRQGLEAQQSAGARSAADIAALRAKEMDAARELLAAQTGKGRAIDAAAAGQTGNTFAGLVAAPFQAVNQANASNQALWGNVLSGIGNIGAAYVGRPDDDKKTTLSDIRNKTNVQPAPEMADDFLRGLSAQPETFRGNFKPVAPSGAAPAADAFLQTLKPQSFNYKAPDGKNKKPGKRMGVMAQDLPDHDVVSGPDGKKWISADVINDVLAGVGRLHDRVGALEGGGQQRQSAPQGDPMQAPMIPREAVHDYLASLGIAAP